MQRRLFLCLPLAPVLALADPQGKGKGKAKGHQKKHEDYEDDSGPSEVRFHDQDVRIIQDYYHAGRGLPPGLAKRGGDLPPGLEKQLRRNGTLPPGLQKKLAPFPVDLERRLPPLPPGHRRVVLGDRAMVIHDASHAILDAIVLSRR